MENPEHERLAEDANRIKNWKRWGPYLSERQWGTVREDYSESGACWDYFPHDQARSRAYRWGEDGLLGICDRQGRLNFALALWNGKDPILKERLFGLTNAEGNHGEDVKECYFYLDSTPTHSYMKALYKYPQAEFPYAQLVEENQKRSILEPEFELSDTGIFDERRYWDITAEYAKAAPEDLLIRITAANRGPEPARLYLLPTLWFRNTWSWNARYEDAGPRPEIRLRPEGDLQVEHFTLGNFRFHAEPRAGNQCVTWLFTENDTNLKRVFDGVNASPYVKDSFHDYLIHHREEAVNPEEFGTKAAALYVLEVPPGAEVTIRLRLHPESETPSTVFGEEFDALFAQRIQEADQFHASLTPTSCVEEADRVLRQARAGLLWSKQFYHYIVADWLDGDPGQPPPPEQRKSGRNAHWRHLFNRDVISMPDKWEYPWYASWDLAFHMIPFAEFDPDFAKKQILLFLREWYMHPNGQIPAYEFAFSDVNPPVHAWAAWRVYKISGARGGRDRLFLERVFQKLLINFTWWVNRKDEEGNHIFEGGFLGLDNIGVFDRGQPVPGGGCLEQADGTAWMAFYCATMLGMALELASEDPGYEDVASKFFEHFVAITDATNTLGGTGLWHEEDGFYYDRIQFEAHSYPVRLRSIVGLIPLFAVEVLDIDVINALPGFKRRMDWFLKNRQDLARHIAYMETAGQNQQDLRLLAIPSRQRLERVLRYLLDEKEFLSPYGIRSLSAIYRDSPYTFRYNSSESFVSYSPGDSTTTMFGSNSNWRGPIWFPVNYLLIEALERYHHFYGENLKVECPTGSGNWMNLQQVANELDRRLSGLFLHEGDQPAPWHGNCPRYGGDPHWQDLVLFHEFFHGDNGRGLGASHQTGWTSLVIRCLQDYCAGK